MPSDGGGQAGVLDVRLRFGQDGQQVRGRLVGLEGGRHNQVLPRPQCQQLHHLAGVHVRLTLGDRVVPPEERVGKLPSVRLVLWPQKTSQWSLRRWMGRAQQSSWGELVKTSHSLHRSPWKEKEKHRYWQAVSVAPPQTCASGQIYLEHREANMEVMDQSPVSLVGFLHQRHQHGLFITAAWRTLAKQFVHFHPILRINPETVCKEQRAREQQNPFFRKRKEQGVAGVAHAPMLFRHPPAEIPATHLPS